MSDHLSCSLTWFCQLKIETSGNMKIFLRKVKKTVKLTLLVMYSSSDTCPVLFLANAGGQSRLPEASCYRASHRSCKARSSSESNQNVVGACYCCDNLHTGGRSGSVGNPLAMQTQQTRSFCRLIMGTKGPHNTLIKHRSFCTGR